MDLESYFVIQNNAAQPNLPVYISTCVCFWVVRPALFCCDECSRLAFEPCSIFWLFSYPKIEFADVDDLLCLICKSWTVSIIASSDLQPPYRPTLHHTLHGFICLAVTQGSRPTAHRSVTYMQLKALACCPTLYSVPNKLKIFGQLVPTILTRDTFKAQMK